MRRADVRSEGPKGRRSVIHSTLLSASLTLLRVTYRHYYSFIRARRPIPVPFIHHPSTSFLAATIRPSTYRCCNSAGPETTLVLPRGAADLVRLDQALGPGVRRARAPGHVGRASRALYAPFILILTPAVLIVVLHRKAGHLRHYTELFTEPLLRRPALCKVRYFCQNQEHTTPPAHPSSSRIKSTIIWTLLAQARLE